MKNNIIYMWNFKPSEKREFPINTIDNNKKFFENFKIINPSDIEELLNLNEFEDLKELYNLIPHWVSKADLGRLLYIYYNGGFYIDADCFIKKNIDINDNNCFLFIEKIANISRLGPRECKNPDNSVRIANYCFGTTVKKHPFIKQVIIECLNRIKQICIEENIKKISRKDILWLCGPDAITSVYHNVKNDYKDIKLLNRSYLRHNCTGSWKR